MKKLQFSTTRVVFLKQQRALILDGVSLTLVRKSCSLMQILSVILRCMRLEKKISKHTMRSSLGIIFIML